VCRIEKEIRHFFLLIPYRYSKFVRVEKLLEYSPNVAENAHVCSPFLSRATAYLVGVVTPRAQLPPNILQFVSHFFNATSHPLVGRVTMDLRDEPVLLVHTAPFREPLFSSRGGMKGGRCAPLRLTPDHPLAGERFCVGTLKPTPLSRVMFASSRIPVGTFLRALALLPRLPG